MKKLNCILIIAFSIFAMGFIADRSNNTGSSASLSRAANEYMWNSLHQGHYDSIPVLLKKLEEAKRHDPSNPTITAHLGFVHLWAFAERERHDPNPDIVQHVSKSNAYFKKAIELNPNDARLKGFQSATQFCEGALEKDVMQMAGGYVKGRKAIKEWPQFNRFALSLIESQGKKNSLMFRQGIKYQWQLIDECSCKTITEEMVLADPDKVISELITELQASDDPLIKRACWNSWIAPHNLEGFLLNLGDMLVKQGRVKDAKKIYAAAKLSPSFGEWVYKDMIDDRIRNAEANAPHFNKRIDIFNPSGSPQIFINSGVACVSCHQMSKNEYEKWGCQFPNYNTYSLK
jgi:hypothetical protein